MRIFITSHSSRYGGSVSVAQNLIAAFGRAAPQHDYFVTIPPELGYEEGCQKVPRCQCLVYRHEGQYRFSEQVKRWRWEIFTLPGIVRQFQPDVIFNMANRGFLSPPAPQATLIHDPHLFYPFSQFGPISWRERLTFWYHRRHLRKSLRATQLVFCQTAVGQRRLRSVYGGAFEIRHYASPSPIPIQSADANVAEPDKLCVVRDKFKLFVPSIYYTHKNLEIIPRLFAAHRDELRDVAVVLTLTADEHPNAARILREVARRELGRNIITVGRLRLDELAAYYLHTGALLFPTLLESFGLPYVEAMQFGVPILTSDRDFAREVCGNAAEYFGPLDTQDICHAILKVKNDAVLRARLVAAGKQRQGIRLLSWDKIGQGMLSELEGLATKRARTAKSQIRSQSSMTVNNVHPTLD